MVFTLEYKHEIISYINMPCPDNNKNHFDLYKVFLFWRILLLVFVALSWIVTWNFCDTFLSANAWEEGDEVVLITCRLENPDLDMINGSMKEKLENFNNEL